MSKWKIIAKDFNSPFFRNYIWSTSPYRFPGMFGIPRAKMGIVSRNNAIEYIAEIDSWVESHEALKSKALANKDFVNQLIDDTNTWGESFNLWSERQILNEDLSVKNPDELLALLKEFEEKQSTLYSYGITLPILDFLGYAYIERNLEEILKHKLNDSKLEAEYKNVFTQPIHNSFAQDQEEDLLKLVSEFYSDSWKDDILNSTFSQIESAHPLFCQKLKLHTNKYSWVYYVYAGPAFTEKDFLGFIIDYLKKGTNPLEKLKELEEKKKKAELLREGYSKELELNEFEEMILRVAGKMVWAKPRRKDYQSRSYFHLEKLHREIAKRLKISLSQVRNTNADFLQNGFRVGSVDVEVLNDIGRFNICVPQEEGVEVLRGQKAQEFYIHEIEKEPEEDMKGLKEIKGTVSFAGKVRGIVRVINTQQDMHKMKDGDILVSVATTPSVVPTMRMAAAIVTDEGGLTCHAAIISRELGITCIVGTKIATKVLKDGDTVEVDAEKGIVRILS